MTYNWYILCKIKSFSAWRTCESENGSATKSVTALHNAQSREAIPLPVAFVVQLYRRPWLHPLALNYFSGEEEEEQEEEQEEEEEEEEEEYMLLTSWDYSNSI